MVRDKQERVSSVFEELVRITGTLEFYDRLFPTDELREQLAKTYIDVLDLIVRVTEYCAIGKTCRFTPNYVRSDVLTSEAKIVDVLTSNAKYDFDKGLQTVRDSYNVLKTLVEKAMLAMQNDMFELLNYQTANVNYLTEQSVTMALNIASLSSKLEAMELNQSSKFLSIMIGQGDSVNAVGLQRYIPSKLEPGAMNSSIFCYRKPRRHGRNCNSGSLVSFAFLQRTTGR